MREPGEPDVHPLSLKKLVLIAGLTFFLVFVFLEVEDPRWIGALRGLSAERGAPAAGSAGLTGPPTVAAPSPSPGSP